MEHSHEHAIGRPMEILLVEDNFVHARLAMRALADGGIKHRATLVCDGDEAMDFLLLRGKFAKAPRPDLILLDLRLPGMDGPDLLAGIRADENLTSIPVVVMTASEEEEDRKHCQSLDVQGYLVKPFDLQDFIDLVRELRRFLHADVILPQARAT